MGNECPLRLARKAIAAVALAAATLGLAAPAATAAAPAPTATAVTPAAAAAAAPATRPASPPVAVRSGLPWASGVYIPGKDPAAHAAFAGYRGAPTDVVVTWPARRTWADLTGAGWMYAVWSKQPQTAVYGFPPFPEDGSTLAACAAGAYTGHWTTIGRQLQASGSAERTVIRLGWELNGDWYRWSARNPAQFAECWRRIHRAVEAQAPAVRWDWTVNRGPSPLGIDPRDAYPGDAFVDYVGVDSYDWFPGVLSEEAWQEHYAGPFGLRFWADFARAHGKRLSVPEWGVHPGTQAPRASGGDNAFYIRKMVSFFAEQRDVLAYESYFNGNAAYYGGSLSGPVQVPKASAEYARQVRALAAGVLPGPTTVYRSGVAYSASGVWAAAPTAVPTRTGVTVSADVAVNRPVDFARQARIAIRDAAGRSSDARGSLDVAFAPATVRAGVTLRATRALAPGRYSAVVLHSVDGTTWEKGARTTFTVG